MPDDLAARLIDALYAGGTVRGGCRANHARGLLVQGSFHPSDDARRLTRAPFFQAERAVIARFSSSSADPKIAQDDPSADPRGCALHIGDVEEALTLVGHSLEAFPARSPEEFLAFLEALNHASEDPGQWTRHLDAHPAARRFVQAHRSRPRSFASLTYHMLHPYRLKTPGRRPALGRLSVEGPPADSDLESAGSDYLDEELRDRLQRGSVDLQLVMHLSAAGEAQDEIGVAWPADGEIITLGVVRLTRPSVEQGAQRHLTFDPSILPAGLSFAGDPMLAVRLAAYKIAFGRRLGAGS